MDRERHRQKGRTFTRGYLDAALAEILSLETGIEDD
jgi:hypothetical protein